MVIEKVVETQDNPITYHRGSWRKKHHNRTELIFKTFIQQNFLEIKEDLNLQIKRAYHVAGKTDLQQSNLRSILVKPVDFKNEGKVLRAYKQNELKTSKARELDWNQTSRKQYKNKVIMEWNFQETQRKLRSKDFISSCHPSSMSILKTA